MAKTSVSDWDATASNNTDIDGVDISGTTGKIKDGDNAIRSIMSQVGGYTRRGADLASAATLNLDSIDTLLLNVTGTTTVTAVTLTSGHWRIALAAGAFQMTASASLIVNGSASVNYTTIAGDYLLFEGYAAGVVRVTVINANRDYSTRAPAISDGAALGSTTLMWSDVFLAAGAVVNLNNGDVTLTHSAGNLALAGSATDVVLDLSAANAGQIKFPATQNPSTDANILDDYEKGVFVPTIAFGGASAGVTYTTQTGSYTKIGRLVVISLRIVLSAKGTSTGSATVAGLPFAASAVIFSATPGYYQNLSGLTGAPLGHFNASAATISLRQSAATIANALTDAHFTNTSDIIVSSSYEV